MEIETLVASWEHWGLEEPGYGSGVSRLYLVRTPHFELAPRLDLRAEGAPQARWFELGELEGLPTRPADLAGLVRVATGS